MRRRTATGLACLAAGLLAVALLVWTRSSPAPAPSGATPTPPAAAPPAPLDLAPSPRTGPADATAAKAPQPGAAPRRAVFRIADAAGRPVAGARVWVHDPDGVDRRPPAVTDTAGIAIVDRVPEGETYFHAAVPGYRVYFGGLDHGPPEDGTPVPVTLEAGVASSLRVVAGDPEEAVRDAKVGVGDWSLPLPVGVTDATGTIALPGLEDNAETTVAVSAPGFRTSIVKLRADGGRPEREVTVVRLERGGAIRGVVLDADGGPVAGADVRLRAESKDDSGRAPAWEPTLPTDVARFLDPARLREREIDAMDVTDAGGRFAVDGLAATATYRVVATRPGHACADVSRVRPVLEGSPGPDLVLRLRRPAALRVRVVPPAGEAEPYLESIDWATAPPPFERRRAQRDPDDRIRLLDVPPGRILVYAKLDGFLPAATFVDVAEGATIEVDLPLSRGATVVGSVVDVGGLPLAEASVVIDRWSADGLPGAPSIRTRTDGSGRFSVSGVWPGPIHLHVRWKDDRGRSAGAFRIPATAPARDLRIVLAPEGSVRMRLLDAERRPYTRRVEVMLSTDGGGKGGTREPDDGVLSHDGLSDGDYVWVVCPSDAAWVRRTFSVRGGAAVDLDDVVLDVGATITGRALDPAGHPIAGAKVRCPEAEDFRWTRTDADGRFTMEHVPRTAVRLVFETDDRYMERTVDPSNPSPIEVRLR